MPSRTTGDWSSDVHGILGAQAVRQIAFVPDAGLANLLDLCAADEGMTSVSLTSEQEGIGLLAGAWLGGARGVLLMQSSGIGNCVNTLSLTRSCRFPLLMIVTMRGEWGEFNPWQVPMGLSAPGVLERVDVVVERPASTAEIGACVEAAAGLAFGSMCAVAVLISQRLLGAKTFEE